MIFYLVLNFYSLVVFFFYSQRNPKSKSPIARAVILSTLSPPPLPFHLLPPPLSPRLIALHRNQPSPMVHLEPHHRRQTRRPPPQSRPPLPIRIPHFRRQLQVTATPMRPRSFLWQTHRFTLQAKLPHRLQRRFWLPL